MKCVIVGKGRIGTELRSLAHVLGYDIVAVCSSKEMFLSTGHVEKFTNPGDAASILKKLLPVCQEHDVQIAFFAIPSGGDGLTESVLMRPFLMNGKHVVTAGKAAMAHRFDSLTPYMNLIGCDASVGGGTGFLLALEQNVIAADMSPVTIKGVFNGTMNYILSGIWEGRPMYSVLREAVALGYAEPFVGEPDALRVFRDEIGDVTKKLAITVNRGLSALIGFTVNPSEFNVAKLDIDALADFTKENARMKYVVHISTYEFRADVGEKDPGSISLHRRGLHVVGGFHHVPAGSSLDGWLPHGVGNAFKISQGGNEVLVRGEGAGPRATARRMLLNANRLVPLAQKVVPIRAQA